MGPAKLRIDRPAEQIYAFYAGRDGSGPPEASTPTWVDEGLSLGTASYAIVDAGEALVVDTQTSLEHALLLRRALEDAGVKQITVLLSHWHLDHVAGTGVFADCEIISGQLTDELLARHQPEIESGVLGGPPAITPLIRADRILSGPTTLTVGRLEVELFAADIHSADTYLVWLGATRTLLAADAVEDPITYVAEPDRLAIHLADLERLATLAPARILPAHGDPEVIAAGGYGPELITATQDYVRALLSARNDPTLGQATLLDLLAEPLERGVLHYHAPYEQVHRDNLAAVLGGGPAPA